MNPIITVPKEPGIKPRNNEKSETKDAIKEGIPSTRLIKFLIQSMNCVTSLITGATTHLANYEENHGKNDHSSCNIQKIAIAETKDLLNRNS